MSNAPLIVDGAKKLASLVKAKPADAERAGATSADAGDLARLQDLERRQAEAAELLRSLAQTNAQLTQALGALRVRAMLSLWVSVIALAVALALAAWLALR
ncbi:MAG TPA: hypothetical protein VMH32_23195 [Burkholderiales bacterium]|nr:hypothetical protein [Burkholderiales bacterium]